MLKKSAQPKRRRRCNHCRQLIELKTSRDGATLSEASSPIYLFLPSLLSSLPPAVAPEIQLVVLGECCKLHQRVRSTDGLAIRYQSIFITPEGSTETYIKRSQNVKTRKNCTFSKHLWPQQKAIRWPNLYLIYLDHWHICKTSLNNYSW